MLSAENYNPESFCQKLYEQILFIFELLIRQSVCPKCGCSGCLSKYGTYTRKLHTNSGECIPLRIQRYRCSGCGSTHAVLLSFIIPFIQVSVPDACTIIEAEDNETIEKLMILTGIDTGKVHAIRERFRSDWADKIPHPSSFTLSALMTHCLRKYNRWFLQKQDSTRRLFISSLPT